MRRKWSITRINREQSPFPDDNNVHPEFGKKWAVKAARPTTGTRAKYPDYLHAEKPNKVPNNNSQPATAARERERELMADIFVPVWLTCFALSNVRTRRSACIRDYPPLRFKFEFDRRHRRARHIIESPSWKLWRVREFAAFIEKYTATFAQHCDNDHREVHRGYVKAAMQWLETRIDMRARNVIKRSNFCLFSKSEYQSSLVRRVQELALSVIK